MPYRARKQLCLQVSGAKSGGNGFRVLSYFRPLIVMSCRGRTGTTVTSKTSIAMACVVPWLSMIQRIPMATFMTWTMVREIIE